MSKTILELPIEMLISILDKLHLIDLVKCRLVSKKFKSTVDAIKKTELIVLSDHPYQIQRYISHDCSSNLYIKLRNSFQACRNLEFFDSPIFLNMFSNIKSLYLLFYPHNHFQFTGEFIKQFNNLESLNFGVQLFHGNLVIDLPCLKEFTLIGNYSRWVWPTGEKVFIKGKLERIYVSCDQNQFIVENPENVQYVSFCDSSCAPFDISKFEKLKVLRCQTAFYGSNINVIKTFKNLEQLYLIGQLNQESRELINHLISLKSENLNKIKKICYYEKEIKEPIDKNFNSDKEFSSFNYETLSTNLAITSIIFDDLAKLLENNKDYLKSLPRDEMMPRLPICFFDKFSDIRSVTVKELEDEIEFLNFLRKCKYLRELDIRECKSNLSQNFIDQLPSICGNSMYTLSLTGKLSDQRLNFEPILQLTYLGDLVINNEVSDVLFGPKLFKTCPLLLDVRYRYLGETMSFSKIQQTLFIVGTKSHLIKNFDSTYKAYNKKKSIKLVNENFSKRIMYSVKYFCRKLSIYGFNYEQLETYLKSIDSLHKKELKKGTKVENEYTY